LGLFARLQPGVAMPSALAGGGPLGYQGQMNRPGAGVSPTNKQQRVFTGTVTKVSDNFGFVDEDVFFQTR